MSKINFKNIYILFQWISKQKTLKKNHYHNTKRALQNPFFLTQCNLYLVLGRLEAIHDIYDFIAKF